MSDKVPGGLTAKQFKYYAAETGNFLWGTIQGAWNEKQTVNQIVLDAAIGMIPLVGDVTAVRDLIAIVLGLATSEKKRQDTSQWVLLVIFLFALIPVFGGVIKGVGRLTLRVADTASARLLAEVASNITAWLHRIGHKNAPRWLKNLDVRTYKAELLHKFRSFCDTIIVALTQCLRRFHKVMPQSMISKIEQVVHGLKQVKALGESMIPKALEDFHAKLKEIQKHVYDGLPPKAPVLAGPPAPKAPSRATVYTAQTGQKTKTYVDEARMLDKVPKSKIVRAGKYPQNVAAVSRPKDIQEVYTIEPGFPDLTSRGPETKTVGTVNVDVYTGIAAASGKIKNEMLEGTTIWRSFGPKGKTLGVNIDESKPMGMWWGLGPAPKSAKEWREVYAVLDDFNRNGWLAIVEIPKGVKIPACTSTVSEQFSVKTAGQYLPGGGKQAATPEFFPFAAIAESLYHAGGGRVALPNGAILEIRPTGWATPNGVFGYGDEVIPYASMLERLNLTEYQSKVLKGAVTPAKTGAQTGTKISAAEEQDGK